MLNLLLKYYKLSKQKMLQILNYKKKYKIKYFILFFHLLMMMFKILKHNYLNILSNMIKMNQDKLIYHR